MIHRFNRREAEERKKTIKIKRLNFALKSNLKPLISNNQDTYTKYKKHMKLMKKKRKSYKKS